MSVYVTMKVAVDPAAFERAAAEQADVIDRIMDVAKANGCIAHRWFRGDGQVMAVDEWTAPEGFQAFMGAAEAEIGPFLAAAGVTGPPDVTVWEKVAIDDVLGWGA